MNEQANPTQETVTSKETQQEVSTNSNAEQTTTETSGQASGQTKSEQVDFEQMYNMLTERDRTIKSQQEEIAELKKTNTQLLLKVNASSTGDAKLKNPYENFIDSMVNR